MMLLSVIGIERSLCSNKGITRTSTAAALLSFFEFEQIISNQDKTNSIDYNQI